MDHIQAEVVCHGVGTALPSSAPPLRAISSGEQPLRPNPPTTKMRCRAFVVPAPRLKEGAPVPNQDALSLDGVLPRHLPDEMVSSRGVLPRRLALPPPCPIFATATTKAPPPRAPHPSSFTELLLASRYNTGTSPLDHDAGWGTPNNASTLPLGYKAVEDDRSPTRMPVFDWTPTPTLSMADNASQVMCAEM
jgi:hypothetical protein